MRLRPIALPVLAGLAAVLTGVPAASAVQPGAAVVAIRGRIVVDCFDCPGIDPGTFDGSGFGVMKSTVLDTIDGAMHADFYRSTTPDLCAIADDAWGTFDLDGLSGEISWLRVQGATVLSLSNVSGRGFSDAGGSGPATIVLDDPAGYTPCSGGQVTATLHAVVELTD